MLTIGGRKELIFFMLDLTVKQSPKGLMGKGTRLEPSSDVPSQKAVAQHKGHGAFNIEGRQTSLVHEIRDCLGQYVIPLLDSQGH